MNADVKLLACYSFQYLKPSWSNKLQFEFMMFTPFRLTHPGRFSNSMKCYDDRRPLRPPLDADADAERSKVCATTIRLFVAALLPANSRAWVPDPPVECRDERRMAVGGLEASIESAGLLLPDACDWAAWRLVS